MSLPRTVEAGGCPGSVQTPPLRGAPTFHLQQVLVGAFDFVYVAGFKQNTLPTGTRNIRHFHLTYVEAGEIGNCCTDVIHLAVIFEEIEITVGIVANYPIIQGSTVVV